MATKKVDAQVDDAQIEGKEVEESAVTDAAPADVEPEDEISAEVMEDRREEAAAHLAQIRELKEKDNLLFVQLAEHLARVRDGALYLYCLNPNTSNPYTSFKEFLEFEVDYGDRKAAYLLNIWDHYVAAVDGDATWLNEIQSVGWTKLMLMIPVITAENSAEWVEKANSNSTKALKLLVDEASGKTKATTPTPDGLRTEQTKRVGFALFPQQEDNLNAAITTAQALLKEQGKETDNKSEILDLICVDFVANNGTSAGNTIESILERIEGSLGVKLVALDFSRKDNSIRYGMKSLVELQKRASAVKKAEADEADETDDGADEF